jgi:phosphohistidine phosphatase
MAATKPKGADQGAEEERGGYQLFILRHGIAADRESFAGDDAERPLTPKGRKRLTGIAAELRKLGYEFDWIVTSPLVRAAETAEIVATAQTPKPPMDVCPALRPSGSLEDVLAFLATNPSRRSVMLVGHEPDLSLLAGRLIGAGREVNLELKKGGCCLIEYDGLPERNTGRLVWWLTPKVLRATR